MNRGEPLRHLQRPPSLKKGDTVAIVSPAGAMRAEHLDLLDRGTTLLTELGLRPRIDPEVYQRHLYMAGRGHERAEHLMSLFLDPEVKGILTARGGYGSSRILSLLEPDVFRKNVKVFVGSSDITSLHLYLLETAGMVTYYGPNVASPQFARGLKSMTIESFRNALIRGEAIGEVKCNVLREGTGKGPVIGGCLSNLVTLIGTPFQPDTEGCILFLEDVGEAPYRIDRMLTHLRSAGILKGIQGIVFGEMVGCDLENREKGLLWKAIDDALEGINIPIVYDLPAGHGKDCLTIPLGLEGIIDGNKGMAIFREPPTESNQ